MLSSFEVNNQSTGIHGFIASESLEYFVTKEKSNDGLFRKFLFGRVSVVPYYIMYVG